MISSGPEATSATPPTFLSLGLADAVQAAVDEKGYTIPTAIQAQTIPHMLQGRDVLGQASTGTGKTAAFALPILSRLDLNSRATQVLVLAPTRELAIQVSASFATYGKHMRELNVQPIYGGAPYYQQMKELKRGVQVVVGTPGRVMDHMRRGALVLDNLKCVVLDEADEMLRMGFVDDVQWILDQTPPERQCALFSATMPEPIRKIANKHLKDPATITIRSDTSIASTIRPRYLLTAHRDKTSALIRILETEITDGVIVFVKTRETTLRVAEELAEQGFSAIAINGDIVQKQREHTIEQLRNGKLDVLVATDVAARGLDVQRISHVINYDLPHDAESWIHRIGRTGRAGRQGEAILLLTFNERRHLRNIERATRQPIAEMQFPSAAAVNARRRTELIQRITEAMDSPALPAFRSVLSECQQQTNRPMEDIAAAVAVLMQGDRPFFLEETRRPDHRGSERPPRGVDRPGHSAARPGRGRPSTDRTADGRPADGRTSRRPGGRVAAVGPAEAEPMVFEHRHQKPFRVPPVAAETGAEQGHSPETGTSAERPASARHERPSRTSHSEHTDRRPAGVSPRPQRSSGRVESGMETFRVEVGHDHGVKPGNIVGAIANEAGLDSKNIGRIEIREDHSFVDLPEGMPTDIFRGLKDVVVLGRHLRISRAAGGPPNVRRTGQPDRRPMGRKKHDTGKNSGKPAMKRR